MKIALRGMADDILNITGFKAFRIIRAARLDGLGFHVAYLLGTWIAQRVLRTLALTS